MCSHCRERAPVFDRRGGSRRLAPLQLLAGVLAFVWMSASADAGETSAILHVAADPNNLPFSNERREGFENRIVELLARELGAQVEYTWHAQRRGFFRETMKQGPCEIVAGVPRGFDLTLTTTPYYRSSYVLLSRADRKLQIHSLDDPALRALTIGVQMIGDDFANTPPAHALSRRGLVENVRGFTVYGNYAEPNPPARIVDAVTSGAIDLALVWGPLAGYFARSSQGVLAVTSLPEFDAPSAQPFAFDICLGVRKSDRALRDRLNEALARKQPEIDAILEEYGVPRVGKEAQ